jgi:hypothetical protein
MHGVLFTDPPQLRMELVRLGLLSPIRDGECLGFPARTPSSD